MVIAPTDETQLAYNLGAAAHNVDKLRSSIAAGEVTITADAGNALIAALLKAADDTDWIRSGIDALATPAQLGANRVSTAMTIKFRGRADGHAEALAVQLKSYVDHFHQAKAAVASAMGSYHGVDGGTADDLGPR